MRSHERAELARELHDTVAHHVSAIAVRPRPVVSSALTRPDVALDALAVIEEEAARALEEMRSMVGTLRSGDRGGPAAAAGRPRPAPARAAGRRSRPAGGGDARRRGRRSPEPGRRRLLPPRTGGGHQRPAPRPRGDGGAGAGRRGRRPRSCHGRRRRTRRRRARPPRRRVSGSSAWPSGPSCSAARSPPVRAPAAAGPSMRRFPRAVMPR